MANPLYDGGGGGGNGGRDSRILKSEENPKEKSPKPGISWPTVWVSLVGAVFLSGLVASFVGSRNKKELESVKTNQDSIVNYSLPILREADSVNRAERIEDVNKINGTMASFDSSLDSQERALRNNAGRVSDLAEVVYVHSKEESAFQKNVKGRFLPFNLALGHIADICYKTQYNVNILSRRISFIEGKQSGKVDSLKNAIYKEIGKSVDSLVIDYNNTNTERSGRRTYGALPLFMKKGRLTSDGKKTMDAFSSSPIKNSFDSLVYGLFIGSISRDSAKVLIEKINSQVFDMYLSGYQGKGK